MDTSTNSSITAVKEVEMAVQQDARESYSLVDEDSVNGILQEYAIDLKDYLNV